MLFSGEVTFWWFGVTNSAAAMQSNAEQSPNEPCRTRRPIAERSLLMPEASQSPGCSRKKIGRVIGEWRDQGAVMTTGTPSRERAHAKSRRLPCDGGFSTQTIRRERTSAT